MRRSTTSAATERLRLGLFLLAELILAANLVGGPYTPAGSSVATSAPAAPAAVSTLPLPAGRSAQLIGMGAAQTGALLSRIGTDLGGAVDAVTAFWGPDWPARIVVVATGTDEQFDALGGGGSDIAAATTGQRIVFAPGAAAMSDSSLRIVLRHELFHYAARGVTAADAPRWLTEGVADFVARPGGPPPTGADVLAQLPTDADMGTAGPARSVAYDRAWWFARFVADQYGAAALRKLYLRACGPGHPDISLAVRDALGADLDVVSTRWRLWLAR